MKNSFTWILAISLLLLSINIVQADESFLLRLQAIKTMSGEFDQNIMNALGESVAEPTAGRFHLQRPGNFYWETLPFSMKNSFTWILATSLLPLSINIVQADESFLLRLQAIKTMSGEFDQKIVDALGENVAEPTAGRFHLQRPGNFYWETLPPYPQTVLLNTHGLQVYDPDLEQLTVYSQEKFAATPASILSGDIQTIQDTYSIESTQSGKITRYTLKEKKTSEKSFESLEFSFENQALLSMALKDQLQQTTSIKFKNIQSGKPIDESIFQLTLPEGVDVIQGR